MKRPSTADITGLVLAGGRAMRMGGVDKGLQRHHGVPLALHALRRLAPQVGALAVNANRHLGDYAAFGAPVWPDGVPDFPGPLAGLLAGMERCGTAWLSAVPCDAPRFPLDLVARLAAGIAADGADIAVAVTGPAGDARLQPTFCLLRAALRDDLRTHLRDGGRKVQGWLHRHPLATVRFDDDSAFVNANTLPELHALEEDDAA